MRGGGKFRVARHFRNKHEYCANRWSMLTASEQDKRIKSFYNSKLVKSLSEKSLSSIYKYENKSSKRKRKRKREEKKKYDKRKNKSKDEEENEEENEEKNEED